MRNLFWKPREGAVVVSKNVLVKENACEARRRGKF